MITVFNNYISQTKSLYKKTNKLYSLTFSSVKSYFFYNYTTIGSSKFKLQYLDAFEPLKIKNNQKDVVNNKPGVLSRHFIQVRK